MRKRIWIAAIFICAVAVPVCLFLDSLLFYCGRAYEVVSDPDKTQTFLLGLGWRAPFAYMAIQTLQVIIAPVPGEVTGFVGGYLFGTLWGSVYSTIALTLGSWVNFLIGRYLGKHGVRRLFPAATVKRMDFYLKHQGAIVVFMLFILPGFPKDGLCFFLGLTALPIKVLVLLSAIGRVPGTLMLCAQGASLYHGDYTLLIVLTCVCVAMALAAWRFRESLYGWIEKQNNPEL